MVPDLVHQQFAHPHGFGLLGRNLAFATLRADGGKYKEDCRKAMLWLPEVPFLACA